MLWSATACCHHGRASCRTVGRRTVGRSTVGRTSPPRLPRAELQELTRGGPSESLSHLSWMYALGRACFVLSRSGTLREMLVAFSSTRLHLSLSIYIYIYIYTCMQTTKYYIYIYVHVHVNQIPSLSLHTACIIRLVGREKVRVVVPIVFSGALSSTVLLHNSREQSNECLSSYLVPPRSYDRCLYQGPASLWA